MLKSLVETRLKHPYLTDWVGGSTRFTLFPVYRATAEYEHRTFFSAHTQNRKLTDTEEIFTEFDKKWIIIVDYTFK